MPEESLVQISIPNCPANLKEQLERLAEKDRRSLAAYIRLILENHILNLEASEVKTSKKLQPA